jgi:hypothetical protein
MSASELLKRRSLRPSSKAVRPSVTRVDVSSKCETHNGPSYAGTLALTWGEGCLRRNLSPPLGHWDSRASTHPRSLHQLIRYRL